MKKILILIFILFSTSVYSNDIKDPFYKDLTANDYIKSAGDKTSNATNKLYIIDNASNQRNRIKGNVKLENGDILFIQSHEDYSPYNRFKEVMFIIGQAASLYAVIMLNN